MESTVMWTRTDWRGQWNECFRLAISGWCMLCNEDAQYTAQAALLLFAWCVFCHCNVRQMNSVATFRGVQQLYKYWHGIRLLGNVSKFINTLNIEDEPVVWFMNRVIIATSELKMKSCPVPVLHHLPVLGKWGTLRHVSPFWGHSDIWLCRFWKVFLCTRYVCVLWYCLLYALTFRQSLWIPLQLHISKDQLDMSPYQSFSDAAGSGKRVSEQGLFS